MAKFFMCPEDKQVLTSTRKESQDKVTNVSVPRTEIEIRRDLKRKKELVWYDLQLKLISFMCSRGRTNMIDT
jgi:hypothetical protein